MDCNGPLAYGGGHMLHVAGVGVANGKYSRQTDGGIEPETVCDLLRRLQNHHFTFLYGALLCVPLFATACVRRRKTFGLVLFAAILMAGCGGGGGGGGTQPPPPPNPDATLPGTYIINITGTSGTQSQTASLRLTVQ